MDSPARVSDGPIISSPSPIESSRGRILLAGGLLVVVAFAAYHNSFSGPFIYDDVSSIADNPSIKKLWPLWDVLSPPRDSGVTVNGRPVVNLSLAINYVLGGTQVFGYHLVNLLIHTLAGLTLFGLVRRTLLMPGLRARFGASALPTAWAAAALWLAHPLQTESVTYVIQRAEALVGLFYLLTLYCFARSIDSPRRGFWQIASFVACLLGMASKEVMVSAPLIVLLYDRTFVGENFARTWKRHAKLYAGLASTWLLLGLLVVASGGRGGTAGFGVGGITWWTYAFTQCRAIMRYLALALWPCDLVFDYGVAVEKDFLAIAPQAAGVFALVAATLWLLRRSPKWGFLGVTFFAALAPSTSIVPIASETMAEHRMYLPLATLSVSVGILSTAMAGRRALAAICLAVVAAVGLTSSRNLVYSDEMALWTDTLGKWPANPRASNNVGEILARQGHLDKALGYFQESIRQLPNYVDGLNNLGNVLTQLGRANEAIAPLERARTLRPSYAETYNNLGNACFQLGRIEDAASHFKSALRLKPTFIDASNNLGLSLAKLGKVDEAIALYVEAIRQRPNYADAQYNYGCALVAKGQFTDAVTHFQQALRLNPRHAEAHNDFGSALFQLGRIDEATAHFRTAIELKPDYAVAHNNYGVVLFQAGRLAEARSQFERALQIKPDYPDARNGLASVEAQQRLAQPRK